MEFGNVVADSYDGLLSVTIYVQLGQIRYAFKACSVACINKYNEFICIAQLIAEHCECGGECTCVALNSVVDHNCIMRFRIWKNRTSEFCCNYATSVSDESLNYTTE